MKEIIKVSTMNTVFLLISDIFIIVKSKGGERREGECSQSLLRGYETEIRFEKKILFKYGVQKFS